MRRSFFPTFVFCISKTFFRDVIYRIGDTPNFTKGNLWCLSKVTTKYFFYLQCNKCIKKNVNFNKMVELLESQNNLVSVCGGTEFPNTSIYS